MVLSVTNIVPATARSGQDTSILLIGEDFSSPAVVSVIDEQILIACSNENVENANRITCLVPGTISEGRHDIVLESNGQTFTLQGGLIVVPAFSEYPFSDQTFSAIQARMLGRLPDGSDIREGSTYWDIYASFAIEIANAYNAIDEATKLSILAESVGVFLDLKAIEYGLFREPASKAEVELTFTSTQALTIPAGTRVSNAVITGQPIIEFETDEDLTFVTAGDATIGATAVVEGTSGNLAVATLTEIVSSINGVTGVTNSNASSGGRDRETDDEFKSRAIRRAQQPSRGGNIGDYLKWAREGSRLVQKVGVFPLHSGNGTVKVAVLGDDNVDLSTSVIQEIQNYIDPTGGLGEGTAPVGASVTVANATKIVINVVVTITSLSGYTSSVVQAAVVESVKEYINGLEIGNSLMYFDLGTAISLTQGVRSFTSYSIQKGSETAVMEDIVLRKDEKAVAGSVTVS